MQRFKLYNEILMIMQYLGKYLFGLFCGCEVPDLVNKTKYHWRYVASADCSMICNLIKIALNQS